MPQLDATELAPSIRQVLLSVSTGKGTERSFLTAYQILGRLPPNIRTYLADEYGENAGKGGGPSFGPATRVAQVAAAAKDIEQRYLDTAGLQFNVRSPDDVETGSDLCALFRIP